MTITFEPGVRVATKVLLGFAGGTGSGKTKSAMRAATGLAGPGNRFTMIDTENKRGLHYADQFAFDYAELGPPFTPARYLEALRAAEKHGNPVILIDSASHEHAGEGGLLDMHEEEVERMAGADADWKRREAVSLAGWVRPKREHKRFVNALLQADAHVILCFRAEEKIEVVKRDGKTEFVPKRAPGRGVQGWMPVAEKYLPYEMTAFYLLLNDAPGVPHVIKTEDQFEPFVDLSAQIDESVGERFGAWAAGEKPKKKTAPKMPEAPEPEEPESELEPLMERVLTLAIEFGADPSEAQATIDSKRESLTHGRFKAWLERQIPTLQANIDEAKK